MMRHLRLSLAAVGLALLSFAVPTRAAEFEKLLPDDTELVMAIHVRHILDSPIGKKYALEKLHDALKSQDQAEAILMELGFDPFKDLDSVLLAAPGGEHKETFLVLARGKFDMAKFDAKAEDAAKNEADHLKILKVGNRKVYEVKPPDGKQIYVCVASSSLVVASVDKDYVTEALAKLDGTKTAKLKDSTLKGLLADVDLKQDVWIVASGAALPKSILLDNPKVKEGIENVEGLVGGLTFGEDLTLAVKIVNKDAKAAKDLAKTISEQLNQFKQLLAFAGANNPKSAPLVELLGAIKVGEPKGTVVTIDAKITSELIGKLVKLAEGQ